MQELDFGENESPPNFVFFFVIVFCYALYCTWAAFYYREGILWPTIFLAGLLVFARPAYPYILAVAMLPINSIIVQHGNEFHKPFFLIDLCSLCAVGSWLCCRLAKRTPPYPGAASDWFIATFMVLCTGSLLWGWDRPQGFHELIKLYLGVASYLLTISLVRDRRTLGWVMAVFIGLGVLESLVCLVSGYSKEGYSFDFPFYDQWKVGIRFWSKKLLIPPDQRGSATDTAHNIAVYINVPIFFAIGKYFVAVKVWQRILLSISVLVMVTGVLATLTKGAVASLLFGIFFLMFYIAPLKKKIFLNMFIVILSIVALSLVARVKDFETTVDYTATQMNVEGKKTSTGSRMTWWKKGFDKLMETHGIGYGVGGFKANISHFVPDGTHAAVLFDLGIAGFAIWIMIFVSGYQTFWNFMKRCQDEYYRRLFIAYLGGFIMMITSWTVTLYYSYSNLWIYLGLGYAMIRVCEFDNTKKQLPFFSPPAETIVITPS